MTSTSRGPFASRVAAPSRSPRGFVRLLSVLVAFVALATLPSCSTQQRLWGLSPFGAGEPSPDRVNLWPLVYVDGDRVSALWPIYDSDARGFSVRPLVSKDGSNLDLLWPIAHVDLDDGSWWAATAYHTDHASGLFPCVGWGRLAYVGPFWRWKDGDRFTMGGVFPGVWFEHDARKVALFPMYFHEHEPRHADGTEGRHFDGLLVPPLFWWNDPATHNDGSVLFPFWWSFHTGSTGADSLTLFPLFHEATHGTVHRLVTPLGGRGWDESGKEQFTNVLGPLYHQSSGPDGTYTALCWPLFASERDDRGSSWRAFPLASGGTPDHTVSWVDRFCLMQEHSDERGFDLQLFPLYHGIHRGDEQRDRFLLRAIRHEQTSKGSAFRLWPLYSTTTDESLDDFGDSLTPIGFHPHDWKTHFHLGTSLLCDYDGFHRTSRHTKEGWQMRLCTFLTFGHDEVPMGTSGDVVKRDHAGFFFDWWEHERTETAHADGSATVDRHERFPLLYDYERDGKETEWSALAWFLHSKTTPDEERFHAVWHAYSSVTRGDHVSRDVFPFMTWDSAPDESRFSFLWRVFHYERHGDRSSGHVLFIPWGHDDGKSNEESR
jgi:hypothetical protein